MKNKSKFGLVAMLAALIAVPGAMPAQAASPEFPVPAVQPATSDTIVVTPANLDKILSSNNGDVATAMNQVMRAKDQVNIALGNLSPR